MADNPIKYSDLFPDDGGIDSLIKKIQEVENTYKKTSETIIKQATKLRKSISATNVLDEKQNDSIKEKEKELDALTKSMDEVANSEKELNDLKKKSLKLAKEEQRLIEKRNDLTTEAAKNNAELKVEISELNKELKQQARESKGLVGEYEKQSKTLNTLRKRYKDLAAAGRENSDEAKNLLVQVENLDTKLKGIDASVGQFQRNVGDYAGGMREAAEATAGYAESAVGAIDSSGALGEITAKLTTIIGFLAVAKDKLTQETEENTVQTVVNDKATKKATVTQRIFGNTINKTKVAFKAFNLALKASVIGLVVVALSSLAAVLTKTQGGLVKLRAISLSASGIIGVLTTRLIEVGGALVSLGKLILAPVRAILSGFSLINAQAVLLKEQILSAFSFGDESEANLKKAQEAVAEAGSEFKKVFTDIPKDTEKAFSGLSTIFGGLKDEINGVINAATPLAEELFKIERANAERSKTQAELLATSEKLEEIEGDATKSFAERQKAIEGSIKAQREAAELNVKSAEERKRAFELETAFNLQGKAETDAIAIERIEIEKEVLEAKKEASIKGLQLVKVQNQLEQDLIEKNLDILIDGFDNQKTINEQLIADEEKNFKVRQELLNRTVSLQKQALEAEVSEIEKKAKKEFDINELLKEDNALVLNDKIRGLGLSEILEGRLLEIVRDNRTATRDLDQAQIDLNKSRADFLKETIQAEEDLRAANKKNSEEQARLEEQFRFERLTKEINVQLEIAKNDEELTKALLAKKEQLEIDYQKRINEIKLNAFIETSEKEAKELEISLLNQGATQKEIQDELRDDRIKDLKDEIELRASIDDDAVNQKLELARLSAQKEKEIEKEKYEQISAIRDSFINGALDGIDQVFEKQIQTNDKEQQAIKDQISKQQELAKEGLTNSLAFEEAELAKAEQKKIELERQRIKVEEVKALYSAYSAAASSGDPDAITTALRDFAILRATSSAVQGFFEEGTTEHGTVGDALSAGAGSMAKGGNSIQSGLVRGKTHKSKSKGILALVENDEMIFDKGKVRKFGKENMQKFGKAIDRGLVGEDFFSSQANVIPSQSNVFVDMTGIQSELKSVKASIDNKPVPSLHAESIRNAIDLVHTERRKGKRVVSRYRIKKSNL